MSEWYAHVTVATVIEQHGRFLMVREEDKDANRGLVINQPAGHLDEGETLLEAAVRETLEETGWEVEITGVLGQALYTSEANGVTYHRTSFSGRPIRHHPERELDAGIKDAPWMSRDELAAQSDRMRSPLVLATVDQYLSQQVYPLDFLYYP